MSRIDFGPGTGQLGQVWDLDDPGSNPVRSETIRIGVFSDLQQRTK